MINFIKNYVKNINEDMILEFCKKNNICLNKLEINTVDKILKTELEELIYNTDTIISKYKNNFSVDNYNKIKILIIEYKKRYKDYL